MHKGSLLSTSTPAFTICRLFSDSHSDRCEVISNCFGLHFSNNKQCWTSFHMPVTQLHAYMEKYLFRSSATFFWIRLFVFVILDYMSCFCFCILDISFLSVISFANIFSHSVGQHACWESPMKALSALPWGQVRVFGPHEWGPACPGLPSVSAVLQSDSGAGRSLAGLPGPGCSVCFSPVTPRGSSPPVWFPFPPQGLRFLPDHFSSFPTRLLVDLSYNRGCTGVFLPVCS